MITEDRPGLRERKKQRTHDDLQRVALQLFTERGYHDVTIEEIAAEVDVSPRTFYRYFSSKEDVVLGSVPEMVAATSAALAARPRTETVMGSIRAVTLDLVSEFASDVEANRIRTGIIAASPELQQRSAERQPIMEAVLVPFVAERLGMDPEQDLAPQVIVSCTVAVTRAAIERWTAHGSDRGLAETIDEALALVDAGLHSITPADPRP
ncbi:MAG TPA: TetR family transcriptional regulator [Acidimicrobiales bacterium]|nr:TetR family transcriptional regulator [Acidimicrobiales bacterium]